MPVTIKMSYLRLNDNPKERNKVCILVYKKKLNCNIKRNRLKILECTKEQQFGVPSLCYKLRREKSYLSETYSMPELLDNHQTKNFVLRSSDSMTQRPYSSKYTVNVVAEHGGLKYRNPSNNPFHQAKWKVYRCQLSTAQESCCCSCNSDAMFEVMKSLYDCYKKKNCDNCNCILCGHLPREERKLGEIRKSGAIGADKVTKSASTKQKKTKAPSTGVMTTMEGKTPEAQADLSRPLPEGKSKKAFIDKIKSAVQAAKVPSEKLKKAKAAGLLTPMEGKTPEQREKILKGLVMSGIPLPEAKNASERKLFAKVRDEMGLPPEPETASLKKKYTKAQSAGLITPLEGKSSAQKEKVLRAQAEAGLPLPEGRTPSEKALIKKIKASALLTAGKVPSEKLRKEKAEGLLTPLKAKTSEQKIEILKDLAKSGVPLPKAKTASEKKLIAKARSEVGLPPEPESASLKQKYAQAQSAGIITPLEGKTPTQKEKILKAQAEAGLPLPEGRTPSEKALIKKIKSAAVPTQSPTKTASEKLRKAKASGFLTPLDNKTPEQKEKIIRGLAMEGIPIPEGKNAADKKLIDKVRRNLGLPPSPKSSSDKDKYQQAQAAGLIVPLEGKSPAEKEKILKGLLKAGIPLPEGRTASEKALKVKVKANEKLDKKTAKLMTEGKGPSDECICDKLITEFSKTKIPTSLSYEKLRKAKAAGIITPSMGKSPSQKEKILKTQAKAGLPLLEGKTPSEKAMISKMKTAAHQSASKIPSEKLKKAKAAGLLTPLEGKSPDQQKQILRGLIKSGLPLPEGKNESEKKLIAKVRDEMGLPPEPETASLKKKYTKAQSAGLITPLKGKSLAEKEKILKAQAEAGLPLPEGQTASEKALIKKIKASAPLSAEKVPSEKLKMAKAAGLLTPLEGKTPEQQEKILKGLVKSGIPLPEAKNASEGKLIAKVRDEMGLPPEPETASLKKKYKKAQSAGLITPLEGKSSAEKEKILRAQAEAGLPLPKGRTSSEKALMKKIKASASPSAEKVPSEKLKKAKAAGLLTPLEGKTPEQREKILKGLVKSGLPLPEAKNASEKKLFAKVRDEMGLPPEPETASLKKKYKKAQSAGIITPLEGKSSAQKEKILRAQAEAALPLPEGRTPSEKALIKKIKASAHPSAGKIPSEKLKKAKAAGLLTPLEGKTPEQRQKILKGLVKSGLPLPEAKNASEKKLFAKVRDEMGLPQEPETASLKKKYTKAQSAGLITPLEGKSSAQKEKILKAQAEAGLPLPEGRTPSEKALIKKIKASAPPSAGKVPSEKFKKAKAAGLLTPLEGKTPKQREKILKGLVKSGLPLPEAKNASEKKLIAKVRDEMGLLPEPETASLKKKYTKAQSAGIITPLEGKSSAQKEKILRAQAEAGLPLPKGRTPSEKALIKKIKISAPPTAGEVSSEKLRKAKASGLLTPLGTKSPEEREKILRGLAMDGLPLPEGEKPSERRLIEKVGRDLGLPLPPKSAAEKNKYQQAQAAGLIVPLEGKSPAEKQKILKGLIDAGIPLPEGRTPSEKALKSKLLTIADLDKRTAKSMKEGKGPSDECICDQLTSDLDKTAKGKTPLKVSLEKLRKSKSQMELPPESKSASIKKKFAQAQKAGIITPLKDRYPSKEEKILKDQTKAGLNLPEGRKQSEKELTKKITSAAPSTQPPAKTVSEKLRKAKATGILTPLNIKTPEQREKILRGLAMEGVPLPEGKKASEKKLIDKVRLDLGLPPSPKSAVDKNNYQQAQAAGLIVPLEGKSLAEKEKILKGLIDAKIALPEGRTASEKALKAKLVQLTDLEKKTAKSMKEGKGPSDECICDLLTLETDKTAKGKPLSKSSSEKLRKAKEAGIISPGKIPEQKEKIIKAQGQVDRLHPEDRMSSEKVIGKKIKPSAPPSAGKVPSEKLKKAKAAGLLTPLEGKTPEQRENILKGLVKSGLPLPEAKNASEKKLIAKVRDEMGLPQEPETASLKKKYKKAQSAGLITPLEGKSSAEKEKILRAQAEAALPLPEGRTPSEKALIKKIKASAHPSAGKIPSEKLKKAKAAGLLTPLEGKTPEQRENILKGLVKSGLPLPEAKNASEKKLIAKVRDEMGLPQEPETASLKKKYKKAQSAGLITPLEGKSSAEKEKILRAQAEAGLPLPKGRTSSEKALIKKIKASPSAENVPSEKLKKAKAAGLLTPLEGKTPEQREKILKGLVMSGLPLPEAKNASEKKLIAKVRSETGLPPEPDSASLRKKYAQAQSAGLITPLDGKSPAQKEKILKAQAEAGLPLAKGRTLSEKELIKKIKASASLSAAKVPSEKLRKAKAAGLLSPLEGKPPEQQQKILKSLAEAGVPLPEGQTASERAMISKVRTEVGKKSSKQDLLTSFSPQVKKLDVKTAKVMKEGKGPSDECICGILTPDSKKFTPSIKAEKTPMPTEKLQKAKAAGLLTPLEGKSSAQKQKILKGLAEAGVPLPEAKTASDRALAEKVKKEYRKRAESKALSEKEHIQKAKSKGLLTPLTGKTPAQKEKILKGLADAGLPMPEVKTASEKALVKKVQASVGISPGPTTPEKEKIRTKSRKSGEGAIVDKRAKAAGVTEEYEDILKTTTCDRGCGCDKKKIRFKHSYVKIRVTSPDISSLCPCPNECLPGVKGGVFTDNEGIKVTIGSAVGVPSFCLRKENDTRILNINSKNAINSFGDSEESVHMTDNDEKISEFNPKTIKLIHKRNTWITNSEQSLTTNESLERHNHSNILTHGLKRNSENGVESVKSSTYLITCSESYGTPLSSSINFINRTISKESYTSSYIVSDKTESSLNFSSEHSRSIETISIISLHQSSITSTSSHYLCYPQSMTSDVNVEEMDYKLNNRTEYRADCSTSEDNVSILTHKTQPLKETSSDTNIIIILRMSQNNINVKTKNEVHKKNKQHWTDEYNACNMKNDLHNDDLKKLIAEIKAKENISDNSSVFVIVSTSDEHESSLSESFSSTICLRLSENYFRKSLNRVESKYLLPQKRRSNGLKLSSKGKLIQPKQVSKIKECPKTSKEYQFRQLAESTEQTSKQSGDLQLQRFTEPIYKRDQSNTRFDQQAVETIYERKQKGENYLENQMDQSYLKRCEADDNQYKEQIAELVSENLSDCKDYLLKRMFEISKPYQKPESRGQTAFERIKENKNLQVKRLGVIKQKVAEMDTSVDRPCCCTPCCYDLKVDGNVASEILTPMMIRQSTKLGFDDSALLNMTDMNKYPREFLQPNLATKISRSEIVSTVSCYQQQSKVKTTQVVSQNTLCDRDNVDPRTVLPSRFESGYCQPNSQLPRTPPAYVSSTHALSTCNALSSGPAHQGNPAYGSPPAAPSLFMAPHDAKSGSPLCAHPLLRPQPCVSSTLRPPFYSLPPCAASPQKLPSRSSPTSRSPYTPSYGASVLSGTPSFHQHHFAYGKVSTCVSSCNTMRDAPCKVEAVKARICVHDNERKMPTNGKSMGRCPNIPHRPLPEIVLADQNCSSCMESLLDNNQESCQNDGKERLKCEKHYQKQFKKIIFGNKGCSCSVLGTQTSNHLVGHRYAMAPVRANNPGRQITPGHAVTPGRTIASGHPVPPGHGNAPGSPSVPQGPYISGSPDQDCSSCGKPPPDYKNKCECGGKPKSKCKCHKPKKWKLHKECPCETHSTQTSDHVGFAQPESETTTGQIITPGYTMTPRNAIAPGRAIVPSSPTALVRPYVPGGNFGNRCDICEERKAKEALMSKEEKACVCSSKRKRKKVVCECPEPPPEEETIEIDEKLERKIMSDMTQTTSGFNFKFKKRPPVEEEMSFEEAIEYFAEQERLTSQKPCGCEEKVKKRKNTVECECPYVPPEVPPPPPEEELKGFKITVGGKGSASTGLAGVCCFDLLSK